MKESELLAQGYSIDNDGRMSKEIHQECSNDKRDKYNSFYHIWGINKQGEWVPLDIFEMMDRSDVYEGDYLYDIGWCPYCGWRLES